MTRKTEDAKTMTTRKQLEVAYSAAKFFDDKERTSLVRHHKHMTPKGREKLIAALERLIRETEKMIDELQAKRRPNSTSGLARKHGPAAGG